MQDGSKCPVCNEGKLKKVVRPEEFFHDGEIKTVDCVVYICDYCQEELLHAKDMKEAYEKLENK